MCDAHSLHIYSRGRALAELDELASDPLLNAWRACLHNRNLLTVPTYCSHLLFLSAVLSFACLRTCIFVLARLLAVRIGVL